MRPSSRLLLLLAVALGLAGPARAAESERPNFLWIMAEDTGPWLGCYGSTEVTTPHLDALAARGLRFANAWATGVACSPSRSSLFSGMYAVALGTETHRQQRPAPSWAAFPRYLREAGYYCTTTAKTDYNMPAPPDMWDKIGKGASYRGRAPGQPFFHVFSSLMITHMSRIVLHPLNDRPNRTINPATVKLPAYLPDDPVVRDDRAWHLDAEQIMDGQVGAILADLQKDGLADNTIVFFVGDHGGCMPAGKGFATQWGLRVPFIAYFPPKFRHLMPQGTEPGQMVDRLVSFIDFAPTLFSLADVKAPDYLQGRAFAGPAEAPPRDDLYCYRGANGGRWDVVRTVRDARYQYIRNYLPYRPAGQRQTYQWIMPGQQAWEVDYREGKCNEVQSRFWRHRPVEELYDLAADPDEVRNLAGDARYAETLARLRGRLQAYTDQVGDIAFVPDSMRQPGAFPSFYARMHADPKPAAAIVAAANLASSPDLSAPAQLARLVAAPNPAMRYWAAVGLARLAYEGHAAGAESDCTKLLADSEPQVRIAAAEAMAALGHREGLNILVAEAKAGKGPGHEALAAIESLGDRASPIADQLAAMNEQHTDFFVRSALITLGRLPYSQLFLQGEKATD